MPKLSEMSQEEKGMIEGYKDIHKSNRWIANKLGRSEGAIRYYLKNEGRKNGKRGPKSKLSPTTQRLIIRNASNAATSISKLKSQMNLNVSRETVRRVLKKSDILSYRKMLVKPPLKAEHRTKRLDWAKNKVSWGEEWKHVIWSDEKKFNLDGPDGFAYYWHDLRKDYKDFSKRHTGGGSLMIWGCFNFYGKSSLAIISGKLNQWQYQQHLTNHLLPFLNDFGGDKPVFQQDNCRCHITHSALQWLRERKIPVMSWPPYSPDLNPIENIWGILARRVYAGGKQFNTIAELQAAVIHCWEGIEENLLQNLVNSMPDRIYQTIYSHGSSIKY